VFGDVGWSETKILYNNRDKIPPQGTPAFILAISHVAVA